MATNRFDIGEYAIGGRIRVTTSKTQISITFLEWETKKPLEGHSRSFNVNAAKQHVMNFLESRTSFYWSSRISDWISAHTDSAKYNAPTSNLLWW